MSITYQYKRLKVNSNYTVEMLADVLKMNDNTKNSYDDSYWKANLIYVLSLCNNPVYIDEIYEEIFRQLKVDQALISDKHCITSKCLKGLLYYAREKDYDISTALKFIDSISSEVPLYTLKKIITFKIKYQAKIGKPVFEMFSEIIETINPCALDQTIHAVRVFTKVINDNNLIVPSRQSITPLVWEMLSSPLAAIQHAYRSAVYQLYRLLVGYDWSGTTMDPAWYQSFAITMMPSRERRVFDESKIEPIDMSSDNWLDWANQIHLRIM